MKNKILTVKKDGITLMALVITIIVILILAGISIGMITGNNSILNQAANAKELTEITEMEEALNIAYIKKGVGKYGDTIEYQEMDKVIEEVKKQGYKIETKTYSAGELVTGIKLSNTDIVVGIDNNSNTTKISAILTRNTTAETRHYAVIGGKHFEIKLDDENISVDKVSTNMSSLSKVEINTKDNNIATAKIDGNIITITGKNIEGTTQIDVILNGDKKENVAKITAKGLATVSKISETTLSIDGAALLTPTVNSGGNTLDLIWESEDPEIATVTREGIVKCGTKIGTTNVVCRGANGSKKQCTVTSTAKIAYVSEESKPISGEKQYDNPSIPAGFMAIDTGIGLKDTAENDINATWDLSSNATSQENVNKGLVIMDDEGNQFVWIPVENPILDKEKKNDLPISSSQGTKNSQRTYTPMSVNVDGDYKGLAYTYDQTAGAYLVYPTESTNYLGTGKTRREPDVQPDVDSNLDNLNIISQILTDETENYKDVDAFKDTMQRDYNEMIESVKKYGGFYMGRYESSLLNNKTKVVSGATVLSASESKWYGLYARQKNYAKKINSVKSSMIWGSQYNAMLNWMLRQDIDVTDSSGGNWNRNGITGNTITDKINNIVDLKGEKNEWTLEAVTNQYTTLRAYRGGDHNGGNASKFYYQGANGTSFSIASRPTLYITN